MIFHRYFMWIAAALLSLAVSTHAAFAQKAEARFAFVIGNDGYEDGTLPTAANDAALVADALRTAGFDVTGARNLDLDTFRSAYREFLTKVSAAGPSAVTAIYLSGYGLQLEGENYFVPVGATIARETDIGLNAIRISDLTRPLGGAGGRANVIMLDLAYASPFAKQGQPVATGLALVEPEARSLLSFNQAPGMVATPGQPPYGFYAQAISEMIRVAGLELDAVFDRVRMRVVEMSQNQQVPWHAAKPLEAPLVLLERAADAPPPQVSDEKVKQIETASIKDLGPKTGYVAAVKRDRLEDYQAYVDSFPNEKQTKAVRGMMAARREALFWQRTTARHTPNAYWTYLKAYPRGPHAADARRRLARLSAELQPPPQFDPVDYDIAPPPPAEEAYFERGVPVYLDEPIADVGVIDDIAPPPVWWRPPPPPVYDDDDDFFLATPTPVPPPVWAAPPVYVADPIDPYYSASGPAASAVPYLAIPAALAAGIIAGKLLSKKNKQIFQQQGGPGSGFAPKPPPFMPPVTKPPGMSHGTPGVRPVGVRPGGTPVVPPSVLNPPRPPVGGVGLPPGGARPPVATTPPVGGVGLPPGGARPPGTTVPPGGGVGLPQVGTPPGGTRPPGTTVPPPGGVGLPQVGMPPGGTRPPGTTVPPGGGVGLPQVGTPPGGTRPPGTTVPPPAGGVGLPQVGTPPGGTRPPGTTVPPGGGVGLPQVGTPPGGTRPPGTTVPPPAGGVGLPQVGTPPGGTRPPGTTVPPPVGGVGLPPGGARPPRPATPPAGTSGPTPAQQQQLLQQQRQQERQQQTIQQQQRQRELQQQRQQERQQQMQQQRQQQMQQQQRQRELQQRQQQMQQQRQQQMQMQQQRQQQMQQQRQQQMQQQRQQQMQQQRQQQMQQQRQQQMMQQRQQQMMQQRQQQMMQQRQQQMMQQRQPPRQQQPQRLRCGLPGLPRCP